MGMFLILLAFAGIAHLDIWYENMKKADRKKKVRKLNRKPGARKAVMVKKK